MLIAISPAKKLNFETICPVAHHTQPTHIDEAAELIDLMRQKNSFEIASLMKLSIKLADLNMQRYQDWHTPFTPENAKQALFAFCGDVYQGLDATTLNATDIAYAQDHLCILSGLYGLLRPLDLIQPYRLEMGTKLASNYGHNLYQFWGDTITESINERLKNQGDDYLINLASNEYFSSIKVRNIQGQIITPVFKELRQGRYRIISFNAKRARGFMSRYIIKNQITNPHDIKSFDLADYRFNADLSSDDTYTFTRPAP
ncbi:MAG: peroxide stress protein YaaA [Mariprofundus sp.]|nr:peroxide stress protein YaaA [Mariprofundus sp.]